MEGDKRVLTSIIISSSWKTRISDNKSRGRPAHHGELIRKVSVTEEYTRNPRLRAHQDIPSLPKCKSMV